MQISRRVLPLAWVAAVALLPLALFSQETGSDAELRQALDKKMKELQSQQATIPNQPASATAQRPAQTRVTSAQPNALEDALHQKMNEIHTQPTTAPTVSAPEPTPQPSMRTRVRREPRTPETPAMTVVPGQPAMVTPAQPTAAGSTSALEDALHQKMSETQAQPSMPATAATPTAPSAPRTPSTVPQQQMTTPAPAITAAPAQPAPENNTALEQALHQKMEELHPVVSAPPTAAPSTTPAGQMVIPEETNPQTDAKLWEALQQKMSQAQPQQPAPTATYQPVEPQMLTSPTNASHDALQQAVENAQARTMMPQPPPERKPEVRGVYQLPPLPAPPPAVSPSKQQQLNALLQKYMADQITPEEYHAERAKILAQP